MTINDEDEDSNTPLHLSALAGHNKAVSALIDAGAFIDARSEITMIKLPHLCIHFVKEILQDYRSMFIVIANKKNIQEFISYVPAVT